MAISQFKSKRSPTGARYKKSRKKKSCELGNRPTLTKLGTVKVKSTGTQGGNSKLKVLASNTCNLYDPQTKKSSVVKIVTIAESPANRHFTRRNIMVKGTVLDTDAGKAKVTNRPGQEGTVNAVLV